MYDEKIFPRDLFHNIQQHVRVLHSLLPPGSIAIVITRDSYFYASPAAKKCSFSAIVPNCTHGRYWSFPSFFSDIWNSTCLYPVLISSSRLKFHFKILMKHYTYWSGVIDHLSSSKQEACPSSQRLAASRLIVFIPNLFIRFFSFCNFCHISIFRVCLYIMYLNVINDFNPWLLSYLSGR